MTHTPLFSFDQEKNPPVLIIDKKGIIGERVASKLSQESLVVLVSFKKTVKNENIIHIPFLKKNPTTPDNVYSQVIIIDEKLSLNKNFLSKKIDNFKKNNTPIFFATNHKFINEKFFTNTVLKNENLKLGILGDIFATNILYEKEEGINKLILGITNEGKIRTPSNSSQEHYPVLLEDVIESILQICFNPTKDKVYYILPKTPISYLSLATLFKKNFPEIKLDFYKSNEVIKNKKFLLKGTYVYGETYNLSGKLREISLDRIRLSNARNHVIKETKEHNFMFTILFFLILLTLPFLTTIGLPIIGDKTLSQAVGSLKNGDNKKAEVLFKISTNIFFISLFSNDLLGQEVGVLGGEKFVKINNFDINTKYVSSMSYLELSIFLNELNKIIDGQSQDPENSLQRALVSVNNSSVLFNSIKESVKKDVFTGEVVELHKLTSSTGIFWKNILGFDKNKKYIAYVTDDKILEEKEINFYLFELGQGKVLSTSPGVASQAALVNMLEKEGLDGIIEIKPEVSIDIKKHINKNNLITVDFLYFIKNNISKKRIVLFFKNPLIQSSFIHFNK